MENNNSQVKNRKNVRQHGLSKEVMTFTFKILSITGAWLPLNWESTKFPKIAYQVHTVLVVTGCYIFLALQLTLLICSRFGVDIFTDIIYTLPTALSICVKVVCFIGRRNHVRQLQNMLTNEWCLPRDHEEKQMQRNTDEFIKKFTIVFNSIGQLTLLGYILVPFLENSSNRTLPFRIWLPIDLTNSSNFWIAYSLEIWPLIVSILLNVTVDVIIGGFILQACTQLDFLKHRLQQLPKLVKFEKKKWRSDELQRKSIREIAMHHDFIIKFVRKVTTTFDVIVVEQYIVSVLLFSGIVYQFIFGNLPPLKKVVSISYLICMIVELFTYCWFGNKITFKDLEFGDGIYEIDWMALNKKSNESLRFIQLRTSKPIVMSYVSLIVLDIKSFGIIINKTYSAFNVLRNSTVS